MEQPRTLITGGSSSSGSTALPPLLHAPKLTTIELTALSYEVAEEGVTVRFVHDDHVVASLTVRFVDISFYAKQHLLKQPSLLDCGVVLCGSTVEKFIKPTGRTRTAGNGSIATKYYDVSKPISDEQLEQYERVGIRPPSGIFTYAFFEAQYLARSEDPRRGALFLIDPRMIVLQYPMTENQKPEFQTFGGKKVLYFDVLDTPNLQEREEEIKRCRIRGDEQRKHHEEADRKWEEEMEERLRKQNEKEADKPKLSKKAKQKARQAAKVGGRPGRSAEELDEDDDLAQAEAERLHKLKQGECKAKVEDEARREKELEVERKKLEAADAKRRQEHEEARMRRVKSLLQKVQSKLDNVEGGYLARAV